MRCFFCGRETGEGKVPLWCSELCRREYFMGLDEADRLGKPNAYYWSTISKGLI